MKYVKIKLHGGNSYVQPFDQLHQALDAEMDGLDVGEKITLDFEFIEMTPEEYDALGDFDGH